MLASTPRIAMERKCRTDTGLCWNWNRNHMPPLSGCHLNIYLLAHLATDSAVSMFSCLAGSLHRTKQKAQLGGIRSADGCGFPLQLQRFAPAKIDSVVMMGFNWKKKSNNRRCITTNFNQTGLSIDGHQSRFVIHQSRRGTPHQTRVNNPDQSSQIVVLR